MQVKTDVKVQIIIVKKYQRGFSILLNETAVFNVFPRTGIIS